MNIVEKISITAKTFPDSIAIESFDLDYSYKELIDLVEQYSDFFEKKSEIGFAIDLDNSPEWAIIDLALLNAKKVNIPIPGFFTNSQVRHLLKDGGVQVVLTYTPENFNGDIDQAFTLCGKKIYQVILDNRQVNYPLGTIKVTYTSGTTGEPKGVCLDFLSINKVVHSIAQRSQVSSSDRHLSVLPMTTLLENIGGLYTALSCGATTIIYTQEEIGISGATGINPQKFMQTINKSNLTTTILIPQMLDVLVSMTESHFSYLKTMRFVAVGGAPISQNILIRAEKLGLPVYEGYGLSEATSVSTVNGPNARKMGTVGKALSHVDLRISNDGEVLIKGSIFKGYLGEELYCLDVDGYLPTGDIGSIDEDGFLTLKGRKKNIFITSFGRNVSPEWVERELVAQPGLMQAVVFGEGKPWNMAVVFANSDVDIDAAIQQANLNLPDYAKVSTWIKADEPFSVLNNQLTGTARVKRDVINSYYQQKIKESYQSIKETAL
jgi:long-subunit acyl-CoA synthetase (AMP-forming)